MIRFIGFAFSLASLCYLVFEVIVRLASLAEKFVNDQISFLLIPLMSLILAYVVLRFVNRVEKGEEQNMRNI